MVGAQQFYCSQGQAHLDTNDYKRLGTNNIQISSNSPSGRHIQLENAGNVYSILKVLQGTHMHSSFKVPQGMSGNKRLGATCVLKDSKA